MDSSCNGEFKYIEETIEEAMETAQAFGAEGVFVSAAAKIETLNKSVFAWEGESFLNFQNMLALVASYHGKLAEAFAKYPIALDKLKECRQPLNEQVAIEMVKEMSE